MSKFRLVNTPMIQIWVIFFWFSIHFLDFLHTFKHPCKLCDTATRVENSNGVACVAWWEHEKNFFNIGRTFDWPEFWHSLYRWNTDFCQNFALFELAWVKPRIYFELEQSWIRKGPIYVLPIPCVVHPRHTRWIKIYPDTFQAIHFHRCSGKKALSVLNVDTAL